MGPTKYATRFGQYGGLIVESRRENDVVEFWWFDERWAKRFNFMDAELFDRLPDRRDQSHIGERMIVDYLNDTWS